MGSLSYITTVESIKTSAPNCWGCDRLGEDKGPEGFQNPECVSNDAARKAAGLEIPSCGRTIIAYTVDVERTLTGLDANGYPIRSETYTLTDIGVMPLGGTEEVIADAYATYGKGMINALGQQDA